jgi:type II secretory pathway pseudopilin PulG
MSRSLVLFCLIATVALGSAQAQQGKSQQKKATAEQCAALAERIRELKQALQQLRANSGERNEEQRKKEEPYEVFLTLNENLHKAICN